jgi:hypothetical protein
MATTDNPTTDNSTPDTGWVKEWPEKAGSYWFYGWTSEFGRRTGDGPRLTVVKVNRNERSVFRVADGHFLYPSDGGRGFFKPLIAPDLPDISSLI